VRQEIRLAQPAAFRSARGLISLQRLIGRAGFAVLFPADSAHREIFDYAL